MSTQYQFPCECGHSNVVGVSDAGKTISCTKCGKQQQLPGLRDIKKLEPAEQPGVESGAKREWTFEKGIYFSFGMGGICVGLVVAGICGYVGYYKFPSQKPEVRGDWIATGTEEPPVDFPVWGYAPEPMKGAVAYELTIFDHEQQLWTFENPEREPVPKEYFTKWGNSYQAGIESSVRRSTLQDLWKFWYETEPSEPLKEWQEPAYSINGRFAMTFYAFAGVGGIIALAGVLMVVYSVAKK